MEAVKRGFIDLPALTCSLITNNSLVSVERQNAAFDQARQGLDNTHTIEEYNEDHDEWFPQPKNSSIESTDVITRVIGLQPTTGKMHTDLTERFPIMSINGMQYMLIMYSEESNYIHVEPLRSRAAGDYVTAYAKGIKFWKRHAITPKINRMDNESSSSLEYFCQDQLPPITIQFVPPGNHRANKDERAIRTRRITLSLA
jgi:hypothetical protein